MRTLVCGDRNWADQTTMNQTLDRSRVSIVIEGEARGADKMSALWARDRGIPVMRFPAKWDEYGKAAGPIRNQQMLDEGKPEQVIAFHDDIDASKGTADMVRRAKKAGLPVTVVVSQPVAECHHHRVMERCFICQPLATPKATGDTP